ncbi:hypothetical protein MBAV_000107 [Candidatus Magnetobacterium bavaricum]|uniref:Uncharacterized protein n=1 Tax=Candidatus Magnetobacterium bavaricum TaxID=29290 RepID=A0A0F3H0R6_9BACT|nr:hypothetical protein MBAV_000107 [Candidatus Magnetobacterium bavaricum]
MKTYEYYADILPDGHLSLPDAIRDRLNQSSKVRVVILLNEETDTWQEITSTEFLKGYSEQDALYDFI